MTPDPVIIYVPGLKPKPHPIEHREQLFRCLLAGLQRIDPQSADTLTQRPECFEIAAWTYGFYGNYRDISADREDIDAVIEKQEADSQDIADATSLNRRFLRWLFRTADFLPFTIPKLATEELEVHLRDLYRYASNEDGAADAAQLTLENLLKTAAARNRPILLLAHSMGSVIAYDVLWRLSREMKNAVTIDLLVTLGSPLGQKVIQRRLRGAKERGADKYPLNITDWINLAAVGELTAIDMQLKNDYGEMVDLGLVANIDDRQVYNYYRMHGALNVHAEYGYLVNEETASVIGKWLARNLQQTPGKIG